MSYAKYKDLGSSQIPLIKQSPSSLPQIAKTIYKPKENYSQEVNSMHHSEPEIKTEIKEPIKLAQQIRKPVEIAQPIKQLAKLSDSYEIKSMNDKNVLIENIDLVVIDIWGTFCGPCKQIAPRYEELAKKYNDKGKIILAKEEVNLGLSPDIKGVPTFHFYKNGNLVDRVIGADIVSVENKIMQYA